MQASEIKSLQKPSTDAQKSWLFHILKWLIILALALTVLHFITTPLRRKWSEDYLARGDIYLEQKKFVEAEVEYDKAAFLYSDEKVNSRIELADKAQSDILTLKDFYTERNLTSQLDLYDKAVTVPKNSTEAVKNSKALIEAGEYQLAIIPAKTATEMDKEYKDGWVYLALANSYTAKKVELDQSHKSAYDQAASAASTVALRLDSTLSSVLPK